MACLALPALLDRAGDLRQATPTREAALPGLTACLLPVCECDSVCDGCTDQAHLPLRGYGPTLPRPGRGDPTLRGTEQGTSGRPPPPRELPCPA